MVSASLTGTVHKSNSSQNHKKKTVNLVKLKLDKILNKNNTLTESFYYYKQAISAKLSCSFLLMWMRKTLTNILFVL